MASSSNVSVASNVRWQFIDSSNNSRANLTQVKRHVMQEYMRQKKGVSRQSDSEEERPQARRGRPKNNRVTKRRAPKQARSDKGSIHNEPRGRVSNGKQHAAPTQDCSNVEARRDVLAKDVISSSPLLAESHDMSASVLFRPSSTQSQPHPSLMGSFASTPLHIPQSHGLDLHDVSWPSLPTTSYQLIQSPDAAINTAQNCPFNTLSSGPDRDGSILSDYHVDNVTTCSYEPHGPSAAAHDWYTVAHAPEGTKGKVQNTLLPQYRAPMLREHLSNSHSDISDVAIVSWLSAATLEDLNSRPGHKELSQAHMQAAWQMIRARGGPAASAHTHKLANWPDYVLTGYESQELGLCSEYQQPSPVTSEALASSPTQSLHSVPSPPYSTSTFSEVSPAPESQTVLPTPPTSSPRDESKLQCEEFLDFLRRCEQVALYQRENPQSSYITRHTAVQETSILHQILAAPPDTRFASLEDRKHEASRLTTLMILNAALWDYRYTPARAALFLANLEKIMVDSNVGITGSVEALLQILLERNDGSLESWSSTSPDAIASAAVIEDLPDFSQYFPTATSPAARPWFAGRMMKIAHRLSAWSWYRVSELLFSCLTLQVQGSSTALWEADVRKEILDAPVEWL
ncbi:uncharacterized protein N7515_006565 [Penicillium bovifimosum]|uniref:Uncharacterized protein n=1 Tax=Penicillium bovifimosum TaxID=126998 RepID=A0A9W9GWA4_9EURO|nr:uncharacterized protein N7515_006565 [Penicillium bovifimosum]KAJ5130526.1 hypothetical protein N7515_006565 [Penicillium bovifimosum]